MKFDVGEVTVRKRNHLPHWDTAHGIYFVTWNLDDALPLSVRETLRRQRDYQYQLLMTERKGITVADRVSLAHAVLRKYEKVLDQGLGSCVLRNAKCASIVAAAIEFFEEERYRLYAWSVMPNHAHAVFSCQPGFPVDRVMHSWKSFTSKQVNKVLGRSGVLWQEDYFDRLARDDRHFRRLVTYVMNNPSNAGLTDWQFSKMYPDRIATVV